MLLVPFASNFWAYSATLSSISRSFFRRPSSISATRGVSEEEAVGSSGLLGESSLTDEGLKSENKTLVTVTFWQQRQRQKAILLIRRNNQNLFGKQRVEVPLIAFSGNNQTAQYSHSGWFRFFASFPLRAIPFWSDMRNIWWKTTFLISTIRAFLKISNTPWEPTCPDDLSTPGCAVRMRSNQNPRTHTRSDTRCDANIL